MCKLKKARWQIRVRGGISTGLTLGPVRSITQTWSGGLGQRQNIDLLHATFYRPTIWEKTQAKKLAVTIHDFIPERMGWSGIRNPHIGKKRLIQKSDLIICVSKNTANELNELFRIDDERVFVIPHGLRHQFSNEEVGKLKKFDRPTVFYVGHRYGYKNFEILPRALFFLRKELPDIQLILVGTMLQNDEVDLLNKTVGEKNWRYFGFASEHELMKLYQRSHVHCVTSKFEGFGMTTIESISMGTPVIATNIPVFKEVLGDVGFYFDKDSVESLADSIRKVLLSNSYESIAKKGIEYSKQYSWEKSAEAHARAYRWTIES